MRIKYGNTPSVLVIRLILPTRSRRGSAQQLAHNPTASTVDQANVHPGYPTIFFHFRHHFYQCAVQHTLEYNGSIIIWLFANQSSTAFTGINPRPYRGWHGRNGHVTVRVGEQGPGGGDGAGRWAPESGWGQGSCLAGGGGRLRARQISLAGSVSGLGEGQQVEPGGREKISAPAQPLRSIAYRIAST